ncbi:MAG: NAD(P)(+) transhydrogenase (Re/Si-specific) subunit alpha, partial [Bacteroidales bacterium]|nr:NAD(P)(+) transhydrogenase (Re/Si-specific) subunit alpha [Bacteroidales bacterium]
MTIGLLKEPNYENRVALTPDNIKKLIALKVNCLVEELAGNQSFFSNDLYKEQQAEVVSRNDVIEKSNVIISHTPSS